MKIGIIGNGFVGKATKLFKSKSIDIIVYDIKKELCEPLDVKISDIELCDLIFICLPTPIDHDSSCFTKNLEIVIKSIKNPYKIIRSTVPIGFSELNNCFFMPEFLTEINWKEDFINSSYWIFGLLQENNDLNEIFKEKITNLLNISKNENSIKYCNIYWTINIEAEFLKLSKNCFLATKVGIMNELYNLAKIKNINFDNIVKLYKLDSRIGNSHMNVPGYDNLFGYGGTCFPKDTYNLYNLFQDNKLDSYYFQTSLLRNETVDRPERDWVLDIGRTVKSTTNKISLIINGTDDEGIKICEKLIKNNNIVICLDSYNNEKTEKIKDLIKYTNFYKKEADISNKQFFPKLDFIYYIGNSFTDFIELKKNILGIMNTLELYKIHKCKLIFININFGIDIINKFNDLYNINNDLLIIDSIQ